MDRQLDAVCYGPMYLRQPAIAQLVVNSIYKGEQLGHYGLRAYVVTANHVRLLILPGIDPSHLLKSLKGATAREANRLLNRTGGPFWQKESYDHQVRNEADRIPLVQCRRRESLDAARTSACTTLS